MSDAVLTIDAEVQAAIAKLEAVNKTLLGVVDTVKKSSPIYDAYGRQANVALDKVDESTKKTAKSTGILDSTIGKLAGAFTIANVIDKTAGALVSMGKELLNNASYILDLKESTGLTTETLQRFAYVETQTGTQTGLLAKAAYDLGLKLAGGGDSVEDAVERLGLSYEYLRQQSPERQFYAVTDALRSQENPQERNRLAVLLTGKTWKEIAPAVVGDIEKIGRAARVVAEEDLQAISEAQSTWRSFWKNRLTDAENFLGGTLRRIQERYHREDEERAAAREATAQRYGSVTGELRERILAVGEASSRMGHDIHLAAPKITTTSNALAAATAVVDGLTAAESAEIATLLRLGRSNEEILPKLKNNADALVVFKERQQAATKATDEANATASERQEALERLRMLTVDVTDSQREQILSNHALGASEKDIALAMKLHEVQVGKVIDVEKERQKIAEEVAKAIAKSEAELAQATAKAAQQTRERIQTDGVARLEQAGALHTALVDNERKLELAQSTGLQRRLLELKYSEEEEIASLHKKHDATEESTKQVEALIRTRYQNERDQAVTTATSIVERMREQGVHTRAEQQATAERFRVEYLEMKASGQYTYQQLEEAERRWRDASFDLTHQGLIRFSKGMTDMLNIADAVFSQIGGRAGELGGQLTSAATQGLASFNAFARGDWVAGTIAAVGAIGTAIKAVFSGNETKKARSEFADSMGLTLDQLYKKLQSMGAEGQRLANQALNVIGKHDEAGNKRWMNEVSAFFDSHQQQLEDERALLDEATISWQDAEAIAKEFGITTANSGKALETAKIAEEGENIAVKWRQAIHAGMDFKDVTIGMSDEVQALINRSRTMGLELPQSLKEPIEKMIRMGTLTDESGKKMEDLGGLRFSETPMDKLITKLDQLLSKIFGVGESAEESKKKTNKAFNDIGDEAGSVSERIHRTLGGLKFEIPLTYGKLPDSPGGGESGGGEEGGIPAFSRGSDGIQDFGAGTLAMLHGREGVFTSSQIAALVNSAARAGSATVGMTYARGTVDQGRPPLIINAPVDASGSMFQDRRAMNDLADIISERIAAKYRGSFPVGVR